MNSRERGGGTGKKDQFFGIQENIAEGLFPQLKSWFLKKNCSERDQQNVENEHIRFMFWPRQSLDFFF